MLSSIGGLTSLPKPTANSATGLSDLPSCILQKILQTNEIKQCIASSHISKAMNIAINNTLELKNIFVILKQPDEVFNTSIHELLKTEDPLVIEALILKASKIPNNHLALYEISKHYLEKNNPEKAFEMTRQISDSDKKIEALVEIICFYLEAKNPEEATKIDDQMPDYYRRSG